MAIPTEETGRKVALDGRHRRGLAQARDGLHVKISANVKMCVACHGVEVGMAYFDLRVADEINVRVGAFTPAFGEFPGAPRSCEPPHERQAAALRHGPHAADRLSGTRACCRRRGSTTASSSTARTSSAALQTDYAVYAIGGRVPAPTRSTSTSSMSRSASLLHRQQLAAGARRPGVASVITGTDVVASACR
jgi:hypothetical protein